MMLFSFLHAYHAHIRQHGTHTTTTTTATTGSRTVAPPGFLPTCTRKGVYTMLLTLSSDSALRMSSAALWLNCDSRT